MKWGFHSKRSGARRPSLGTAEALTAIGPDHIPGAPPKYHPHLARNNNITTLGKNVITVLHRQIDKRKRGKYRGVSLVWSQWTCIGSTGHGDCIIFTGTVFAPLPSFLSGTVPLPTGLSVPASIVLPSRDDMVPVYVIHPPQQLRLCPTTTRQTTMIELSDTSRDGAHHERAN